MDGLTDKQNAFIDHYFACGFNAAEAARRAGYSERTARSIGAENLTKPDIKAEISRRMTEQAMGPDEVLARIGEIARGDMADFLDETGKIDLTIARQAGKLHLIKSRSITKDGEKVELYSKAEALVQIGKHHGLFVDRTEITDVTPDRAKKMTTEELEAELRQRGVL